MEKITLVFPMREHEEQVMDYKNEFLANGDTLHGTAYLRSCETYTEWYEALLDNCKEETVRQGLVPSSTYLAIRESDQRIVGIIDIRHRLNEYLLKFGGHIGYSVRKSERRKGYAKEMLRLSLEKCKALEIEKVLVTCSKDNIGSAKTIIANDGVLENELPEGDDIKQRYWITLK